MNANILASLAACLRRRYKLTTPLRPTHGAKHVGNKLPLAEHHNSIGNRMLTRTCAKVTFLGVGSAQTLGPREPLKGFAQYPKTLANNRKTQVGENRSIWQQNPRNCRDIPKVYPGNLLQNSRCVFCKTNFMFLGPVSPKMLYAVDLEASLRWKGVSNTWRQSVCRPAWVFRRPGLMEAHGKTFLSNNTVLKTEDAIPNSDYIPVDLFTFSVYMHACKHTCIHTQTYMQFRHARIHTYAGVCVCIP